MSFDWSNYLHLAKSLSTALDEASQRSSISRAYYAAFNIARQYVMQNHPGADIPNDGRAHEKVWQELKKGVRQEKAAAVNGERLKQSRGNADYKQIGLSLPADVTTAIAWAESIINNLKSVDSQPS